MKQHITPKQLNELSKKGKKKLKKWWKPQYGDQFVFEKSVCTVFGDSLPAIMELKRRKKDRQVPLLSIGQMIEFVRDNDKKHLWTWYFFDGPHAATKDICGILWEAVKEILE